MHDWLVCHLAVDWNKHNDKPELNVSKVFLVAILWTIISLPTETSINKVITVDYWPTLSSSYIRVFLSFHLLPIDSHTSTSQIQSHRPSSLSSISLGIFTNNDRQFTTKVSYHKHSYILILTYCPFLFFPLRYCQFSLGSQRLPHLPMASAIGIHFWERDLIRRPGTIARCWGNWRQLRYY